MTGVLVTMEVAFFTTLAIRTTVVPIIKDSYPHDRRADKDSYMYDRHTQCIMLSL